MSVSKISVRRQNARGTEYQAKRAEIMRAGAAIFKDVGYDAATIDEIAKGADIDRATFYYYFKGKQELFREMVGAATLDNVERAEAIAVLESPPEEKLRSLVVALFESYQRHYPYLFVYLQQDMNRLVVDQSAWSAEVIALNDRFTTAVVQIIREGREAGTFASKGTDKIVAAGILGMCNWSHRWFKPGGALGAAEVADIFADMVLNGLLSRP